MDNVLERVKQEFPKQFSDKMYPSELPEGWLHLVRGVCKRVSAARLPVKWVQIKLFDGALRMYEEAPNGLDLVDVYDWVAEAERLSRIVCIRCGEKSKGYARCQKCSVSSIRQSIAA